MAAKPVIRFTYWLGDMKAYIIGPRGGKREVDYHDAWLAVTAGEAVEESHSGCICAAQGRRDHGPNCDA